MYVVEDLDCAMMSECVSPDAIITSFGQIFCNMYERDWSFWARQSLSWPYYTSLSAGAVSQGVKPRSPCRYDRSLFSFDNTVDSPF